MGSGQSGLKPTIHQSFDAATASSRRQGPPSTVYVYPFGEDGGDNDDDQTVVSTVATLFDIVEGNFHTATAIEKKEIIERIMMEDDYYELFGVSNKANIDKIRKQYQKLMKAIHVDRGGDTQASAKVNHAYSVLKDKEKRKQYDHDRTTFLSSPLLYAKHTASSVGKTLTSPWAGHDVTDMRHLIQGDHVYWLMDWTRIPHHGIVTNVLECANGDIDVQVVDFGTGRGQSRPIREIPLSEFIPQGKVLKRAQYGEPWWNYNFQMVGSYKELSDPNDLVVQRAQRLCMVGQMDYELLEQSCETVAFWCKTGKRVSGQANKILRILGTLKVAQVVADVAMLGAVAGVVALFEAGVIGAGAAEGTLAVLSLASPVWLTISVVGGTLGLGFFALRAKLWFERRRLKNKQQPPEVINLVSQLTACDRRTVAPMVDASFDDYAQDLASCLDSMVLRGSVDAMHRPAAMAQKFITAYEGYMHGTGTYPGGADLSITFALQVLVRCRAFNAFLDFPSPKNLSDADEWVVVTLQAAENAILDARGLKICNVHVDIQYQEVVMEHNGEIKFEPMSLQLRAVAHQHFPEEEMCLTTTKAPHEFATLHQVLRELNPRVHGMRAPPNRYRAGAESFQCYLEHMICLSERRSWEDTDMTRDAATISSPLERYLADLQATEVREQLLVFLDPPNHGVC